MPFLKSKVAGWNFIVLFWVVLMPSEIYCQAEEYDLKAVFLEKFTRFIEWPNEEFQTKSYFTITVLGENPFGKKLEEIYTGQEVKGKPVSIKYIDDISKLSNCDLLFISSSEKENITKIIEYIKEKPVLTVGDSQGFAEKGVYINFYLKDYNIHFEINENDAKRSSLKINHLLLMMARIVSTGR